MDKLFRVLIVDDDQNMMRTLADILAASGFAAETAGDAYQGLEKMAAATFGCIVSDIRMPGMNGVAFQQAIKEKYGPIPFLFITAYADYELIAKGREVGALAFLDKPLNIPLLLSILRAVEAGSYGAARKPGTAINPYTGRQP